MKILKNMLAVLAVVTFAAFSLSATAVPPGKKLEFNGGPMGKVIFDGRMRAGKGIKCTECPPKIFKMKRGADKITMAAINQGKFCGVSHNGERAFKASAPKNCKPCHKK